MFEMNNHLQNSSVDRMEHGVPLNSGWTSCGQTDKVKSFRNIAYDKHQDPHHSGRTPGHGGVAFDAKPGAVQIASGKRSFEAASSAGGTVDGRERTAFEFASGGEVLSLEGPDG